MKMICAKADICELDCSDKLPHEYEFACDTECDWNGKCIPIPDIKDFEDSFLDDEVEARLSHE